MTRFLVTLGPLLAGLFLSSGPVAAERLSLEDINRLADADVLILGEIHDNATHHLNQAAVIATLKPSAIVFEMIGPDAALQATPERRRDAETLGHVLQWEESGWPDFGMYYPIFLASGEAAVFGGAIPNGDVRRAVSEGAAAILGGSAPLFGIDAPLDADEQALREAIQMAAHCDALPETVLGGMVEAQRLRDAGLARAVVAASAETDRMIVVITGNGHARTDWGLPRMLSRAMPEAKVVSVGQFEAEPAETPPHDFWFVTEPAERDDPCLAFRNRN